MSEKKNRILDVGCGFKPWLKLFDEDKIEYIGIDFVKEKSSADFIASADKLPFPDNDFDALIYSEVLEHAENITAAIKEMRRVAKNNALVFISAPLVFPEHGIPYDFLRLTRYFYQTVFKEDDIVLIKESNSSLSTAIVSFNLFIESTPFSIFRGIKHLIYIFNNLTGIVVDAMMTFLFKKFRKSIKHQFYLMPLGYALVVRIKK
ncbi:MAG: class I SAM-dependent methyltransferase [Nitrospirota bacterium]